MTETNQMIDRSNARDVVDRLRDKGGALRLEAADTIEMLRRPVKPYFSAANFPLVEVAIIRDLDGVLYRFDPQAGTVRPVAVPNAFLQEPKDNAE